MSNIASIHEAGNQDRNEAPKLLIRGLDSLYVSFYLDTMACDIDWDEIEFLKERIGRERKERLAEVTLGTETFALRPYGKSPYRYVLSNRAFEVRLSERLSPSCHVQFSSEGLWTEGAEGLMQRFLSWAESVGFRQLRPEVISRADWAFDYTLPKLDFDEKNFVTRATKDASWREHRQFQSFQFGVGHTVVRVYDKVAEIAQASEKTWFYQLWNQTDGVWRVEFQIRNARLREAGIRTFEDLKDFQADLLREVATNHTTLRTRTADANRSRWPLHPLWEALQTDIASLPQTGLVAVIDDDSALSWRKHKALKSMLGHCKYIAAIHAVQHGADDGLSFEAFMPLLSKMLSRHTDEQIWRNDVERKMLEIRLGQ
ncbi:MAG: hypothetical protein RIM33_17165 [Alphaproteobacteria bacterium]